MKDYILGKNLSYKAMAFYKPKSVLGFFIKDASYLYSIIPLVIFTILFEISYIVSYISNAPAFSHFLGRILKIPDHQYDFYQIFLFPVVQAADFLLFGGVIYLIAKLMRLDKIDVAKTVIFFIFTWNTIGILGFITESLAIEGGIKLFYIFNIRCRRCCLSYGVYS
ncbi:MAG: hypothetical protein AB1798_14605 [Spirochaetota bacterium]